MTMAIDARLASSELKRRTTKPGTCSASDSAVIINDISSTECRHRVAQYATARAALRLARAATEGRYPASEPGAGPGPVRPGQSSDPSWSGRVVLECGMVRQSDA